MAKTILVTGGAGFIGNCFCKLLLKERKDYKVINVDSLTYAANPNTIKGELNNPNYKFYKADNIPEKVDKVNNRISPIQDDYIEKYFKEKKLDLVATLDGATAYKDAVMVVKSTITAGYTKSIREKYKTDGYPVS